jgi:hypothetical protein
MRKGNSVVNKIKQNGVKYMIHTTQDLGKIGGGVASTSYLFSPANEKLELFVVF